ncbi:helix-turn-helix domain-containing protein [Prosthecomicrobium hirschii]|nr:helix-turn-helix transcriptional regulator [Prosthecomicrobium hirschii]MCW1840443.1 helix-turn-helix domain-containing protein [Prosthecomicrobium hirschii]
MTPAQCRMARAALELGVRELAELAKVSTNTITRLERGEALRQRTVDDIRAALESAGVVFIAENGGGAGVRLRGGDHEE